MTTTTALKNFLVTSTTDPSLSLVISTASEINVVGFMSDLLITTDQYVFTLIDEIPLNIERIQMNTAGLSLIEQVDRCEVLKKFPQFHNPRCE